MAVRHGYGKIAGADALVFAYDTGDTYNSYKGEPTVNIIDGGSNVAQGISGCFQFGNHASSNGGQTVNVNFSNTYAKRTNVLRITNTNGIGYSMINQRMTSNATSGTSYTYSFDYKALAYDGGTWTPTVGVYGDGYKVPDSSYTGTNYAYQYIPLPDGWTRFVFTYTANYAGRNTYRTNMNTNDTTPFDILFDNFQIEENSHVTPFTAGTRSITQGLLDLTGNNTISLNSSTFDSNGQIDLDGTSTSIYPGTISGASGLSEVTFETVVRSNANNKNILLTAGNAILLHYGGAGFYLVSSDGTASGYLGWNSEITGGTGVYEHLAATWDGSTMKLYVNGQKITYDRSFGGGTSGVLKPFNNTTLGGYFNSTQPNFNGNIDVAKIYNRALTAQEVRNNYNHYKTRFNIQ